MAVRIQLKFSSVGSSSKVKMKLLGVMLGVVECSLS